jgi:hypothetical protein
VRSRPRSQWQVSACACRCLHVNVVAGAMTGRIRSPAKDPEKTYYKNDLFLI